MANNQNNIRWYRTTIQKETLQNLTTRSDLRGFLQILSQFFLIFMCGIGVYYAFYNLPLWLSIPSFYIYATFYSFWGLAGAGHELSHKTVFKTKFLNEFFIRVVSFFTWTNFTQFRVSHTLHHQYTVHKGLDLEVVQPLKMKQTDWIFLFTFNLPAMLNNFKTIIRHCLGNIKGETEEKLFPISNTKDRRKLFFWARFLILGHLTLALLFIFSGHWILLLLVTFVHLFAGWLAFLCGFTQHTGLPPDVDDYRLCSRTVKLNPVLSYFYWQMNYHVEHHMYAGVPFYNLKKLRKALEADLPIASKGLIPAWKEILSILHKQKNDPTYFYIPTIPASKKDNVAY